MHAAASRASSTPSVIPKPPAYPRGATRRATKTGEAETPKDTLRRLDRFHAIPDAPQWAHESAQGQFYYVRGLGRLETPDDIGKVVLAVHNGTPVLVKDVGEVVIGSAPRLGQFGFNDNNDAVEGVILMRTGEQAQTVLKAVQAKTAELNASILPKDVKVKAFYDRSDLISLTTRTVVINLLRGILLVIVVLIFFLYDVRSGLIIAATIPLSLLFAFICLDLRHIPANLLSIGAIDFGSTCRRRRGHGGEHPPPAC